MPERTSFKLFTTSSPTPFTDECLMVAGITYRTAALPIRERFSLGEDAQREMLGELREIDGVTGVVLLSTCNRTEVLFSLRPAHINSVRFGLERCFGKLAKTEPSEISKVIEYSLNRSALLRLFSLAAGLDSFVLGEPQILGQLKSAYRTAIASKSCSTLLHQVLQSSFASAKLVRRSTVVGRGSVSVCAIARLILERCHGNLKDSVVCVLGAGETAELISKHLIEAGVTRFIIANRSEERAAVLAHKLLSRVEHAWVVPIDELDFRTIDILIGAATGLDGPLIKVEEISENASLRVAIDLSVPRSIDTSIGKLPGITLFSVDELYRSAEQNFKGRESAVLSARALIKNEVEKFEQRILVRKVSGKIAKQIEIQESRRETLIRQSLNRLKHGELSVERVELELRRHSRLVARAQRHPILNYLGQSSRVGTEITRLIQSLFCSKRRGSPQADSTPSQDSECLPQTECRRVGRR